MNERMMKRMVPILRHRPRIPLLGGGLICAF
jgi:hypothetical protein